MSFHAGQTFTFGETPSATKWNYLWENDYALADGSGISDDAIVARHVSGFDKSNLANGDVNPYKVSAYCSTGKSIANTSLIVDLQTELFDSNSNFASSRYTAPVSGFYLFNVQAWLGSAGMATTEYAMVHLRKNGSATGMPESGRINGSGNANVLPRPGFSYLIQLAANDYIELWATLSGSRDIVAGQAYTWLQAHLVSRT